MYVPVLIDFFFFSEATIPILLLLNFAFFPWTRFSQLAAKYSKPLFFLIFSEIGTTVCWVSISIWDHIAALIAEFLGAWFHYAPCYIAIFVSSDWAVATDRRVAHVQMIKLDKGLFGPVMDVCLHTTTHPDGIYHFMNCFSIDWVGPPMAIVNYFHTRPCRIPKEKEANEDERTWERTSPQRRALELIMMIIHICIFFLGVYMGKKRKEKKKKTPLKLVAFFSFLSSFEANGWKG